MAAIRKPNRRDVLVIQLAPGARAAGVFTRNRFCAAPVQVCKEHLSARKGAIRALLINTGCANAGTGETGLANARASCETLARHLGCQADEVLPFSTGVILEHLPMDRLEAGMSAAAGAIGQSDWLDAAQAIMTTDTQPKATSRRLQIAGHSVTLSGISKGAGMIRPNMATMLGYLATDAGVEQALLSVGCARSPTAASIASRSMATPQPTIPSSCCQWRLVAQDRKRCRSRRARALCSTP